MKQSIFSIAVAYSLSTGATTYTETLSPAPDGRRGVPVSQRDAPCNNPLPQDSRFFPFVIPRKEDNLITEERTNSFVPPTRKRSTLAEALAYMIKQRG